MTTETHNLVPADITTGNTSAGGLFFDARLQQQLFIHTCNIAGYNTCPTHDLITCCVVRYTVFEVKHVYILFHFVTHSEMKAAI